MSLNTYPANPFPPSTDQMDADTLEAEVNQLKSGLINLDGLVNCKIGVFGTFKSASSSDNVQYVKFTVPSNNYMTLNGFLFSRYGVYGVMVRTGASGTVFETTITPIIEATGNTASISYTDNDVTIDLGQTWATATLILVQPSTTNSPNVIKNLAVTYLSPT